LVLGQPGNRGGEAARLKGGIKNRREKAKTGKTRGYGGGMGLFLKGALN